MSYQCLESMLATSRSGRANLSESEKRRSIVFNRVSSGALTLEQATSVLGLSYRQAKRIWKRYQEEGEKGLVHRNKGRPSNRAYLKAFKEEVLRRYLESSPGIRPTRFATLLAGEGILVDHETLRRWLLESGAWKPNRCRQGARPPDLRFQGFGEMLTLVALPQSWAGTGAAAGFLVCLRDEATALALGCLAHGESSETGIRLLWAWIERHGIPAALRCPRRFLFEDHHSPTLEQQLSGWPATSPLNRFCERLGIEASVLAPSQVNAVLRSLAPFLEALASGPRSRTASRRERAALLRGQVGELWSEPSACRPALGPDCHVPIVDGTDLVRCLPLDQQRSVVHAGRDRPHRLAI